MWSGLKLPVKRGKLKLRLLIIKPLIFWPVGLQARSGVAEGMAGRNSRRGVRYNATTEMGGEDEILDRLVRRLFQLVSITPMLAI